MQSQALKPRVCLFISQTLVSLSLPLSRKMSLRTRFAMAPSPSLLKPRFFELKKYLVVAVCFVDILILIIYAALAGVMADTFLRHLMQYFKVENEASGRTIVITTTIVTCVCSIFFEFVGIIGALKESGTLLGVYKVGAIGELVLRAVYTVYDGNFAGLLIWEIVLLAVTAVYGYDLLRIHRMNRRRSRSKSEVDG